MALLEIPLPTALELDRRLDHELDEGAARTSLRRQIERLERRLSAAALELWESQHREALPAGSASAQGARLLTVGELEAVRDSLVAQVAARERVLERRAGAQRHARAQLEAMLA